MKNGLCPKCGSNDVRSGAYLSNKPGQLGTNTIPIGGLGLLLPLSAALDNYVCVNCGYVESYISDTKALQTISEQWPKVGPK